MSNKYQKPHSISASALQVILRSEIIGWKQFSVVYPLQLMFESKVQLQ